jgi:phosphoglycerate dehydrogenase-like enzyme
MIAGKKRVVFLDGAKLLAPVDMRRLEGVCEVVVCDGPPRNGQECIERAVDFDVVVVFLTKLDEAFFAACPHVKMVMCASTGTDNIDLDAAQRHGVAIVSLPDYATRAVAEYTVGLMLATARRFFSASCDVRKGCSYQQKYVGKQLAGKTLGIIGCGRIGNMVAIIAEVGLGMDVLKFDRDSSADDFAKLLQESDVVSLHLPLTTSTHHIIGEEEFAQMKDEVIIINTARGGIIDEKALLKYIENGKIFAAGLDVLQDEPPAKDNPLLAFDNVLITPHIAYNADSALENRSKNIVDSIIKCVHE